MALETFSALRYLMQTLGSNFSTEWKHLSEKDKETLKQWAYEENGITPPGTV